jgi:cell division protein FtsB
MTREQLKLVRKSVATVSALIAGNPTISAEAATECIAILADVVKQLVDEDQVFETRLAELEAQVKALEDHNEAIEEYKYNDTT